MQSFSVKITDLPSLYQEPKIVSTIKDNPFKSNTEIEGKEIVLSPDLLGLYRAVGNRHSKGGMDVYLPPESFVFSDFKDLAISPEEHDVFELKKGNNKLQNNTPAKVIQRNIDTQHYNKMSSILNDVKRTEFEKRTAMLMLNKYEDTLGKVAYIQESKKNFPDGLPDFAKDTAPVFDTQLKNEIMENKQYMKWGGKSGNPYKQTGGTINSGNPFGSYINDLVPSNKPNELGMPFQSRNTPVNSQPFTPIINDNNIHPEVGNGINPYTGDNTWKGNASKYTKDEILSKLQSIGFNGPRDIVSAQQWLNNDKNYNQFVKHYHSNEPANNLFHEKGYGLVQDNNGQYDDGNWGHRWDNIIDDVVNWNKGFKEPPIEQTPFQDNPPVQGQLNPITKKPYNQNYGWTNDMKRTTALDAWNAASTQKGQVYRQQIKSPLEELERVNPQAALNNVNNSAYRSSQNLRGINPYLAAGQNANIYGQSLDGANQVQSQYDNQNVQIANQQNSQNNQIQGNDAFRNSSFDNQFFKENELNKAHFENEKEFAWNKVNNNFNTNNEQIDKIRYFNAALPSNAPYSLSLGPNGRYNPIDNPNRNILGVNNPYAKQSYIEAQGDNIIKAQMKIPGATYKDASRYASGVMRGEIFKSLPQNGSYMSDAPKKRGGKIKNNPFK